MFKVQTSFLYGNWRSVMGWMLAALAPAAAGDAPTFYRDVLPLLQQHCQSCHRPGQIAPMSLVTFEETRPWAKAIRREVLARSMPPFHAVGPLGRYRDDWRLSDDAVDRIRAWVDGGMTRGDPADAPVAVEWNDDRWHRASPDLVVSFEPTRMTGTGQDQFLVVESAYAFPEATWVQAIEFSPSNRSRVHHVGVFTIERDEPASNVPKIDFLLDVVNELLKRGNLLYTWLPGYGAFAYPEGQGVLIPAGTRIALQFHIGPSAESFVEESQVGFWFVDGELRYTTHNISMVSPHIQIPPGAPRYEFRGTSVVPYDVSVQSFNVHMHLRGKSSDVWFRYPDGRRENVFSLPQFNFDWQRQYVLSEPQPLPKGTEIEFVATWDNSDANPLNPDPNATVRWGHRTADEMYSTIIQCRRERPRPLLVERGRVIGLAGAPQQSELK